MKVLKNLIKGIKGDNEEAPSVDKKYNRIERKHTVPPHVVVCRVCCGTGRKDGDVCPQCKGSGRVNVSCDITTYITAYVPE